jgi:NADH:ubiquinone oxidoreductase subunit E
MKKEGHRPEGNLIAELQAIQDELGYLPMERLEKLSRKGYPGTDIFSVATFYNQFKFEKKAKYTIYVCTGTACHVKRSPEIISQIGKLLGIKPGEATKDGKIRLETVNCIGACAKAPSMMVNDTVYGLLDSEKINSIIAGLK